MNRAQCFFEDNHFEQCLTDIERVLKLKDYDPFVHYKAGLTYFAT